MICLIWNLLIIYFLIAIFDFCLNFYRMIHTKILRDKYIKNIRNHCHERNYELLIPISKVLSKANIYVCNLESEIENSFGITCSFDNALTKAFYHYKYLMKHCFTWILRIPFPKFKFIHNKRLNLFIRFLVFSVSTITVYFFGLYLDSSGLGLKILTCLSDSLNRLF